MNHLNPSTSIEKNLSTFSTNALTNVLSSLSIPQENSCLQIVFDSTTFFLHFNEGKLVYGTNSLAPFERLERHLRRLGNSNSKLTSEIIKQPRFQFRNAIESYTQFPSDYQSIIWLSQQGYLDRKQTVTTIRRITREIFESLLCIPSNCQYKFVARSNKIPEFCQFDLDSYIAQCQKRLEAWQVFSRKVWSSYQRPYLVTEKAEGLKGLSAEQNKTICQLLKGLNFRQISAVLDLDELVVVKILYPSISDRAIIVRDPKSPFDRLPPLPQKNKFESVGQSEWRGEDSGFQINSNSKETVHLLENTWNVAYVDNEKDAHIDFTQSIDNDLFATSTISDPLSAFAELIELKPDLIVLKINMPDLNGYELCTLLRNYHDFKLIPIILFHEAYQPIDPSRFKKSGATEIITKPFERSKILNIIFKYLQ